MMRRLSTLPVLLLLLSTAGCIPQYHAPHDGPVAKIKLNKLARNWICVAGQQQQLVADWEGYATIPADQRVTIGSRFFQQGYMVDVSCNPSSSIIPAPDSRYYIDFDMRAGMCLSLMYREDPSNRTGLGIDPTLAPPAGCRDNG